ncbi:MAG: methionyl-tRNA formyltransferase [Sneathiellaceae bacterium]
MTDRLRLAFMGTPDFGLPALQALIEAGHEVVAVYAQPPRKAGRGHRQQRAPTHEFAEARGIPVFTPPRLRDPAAQQAFAALDLDVAVVAAYGLILPKPVLQAPRLGCLNIHASLLPRWRGAAPIQRAILAGDRESGATIMLMDEGLDTGPVLAEVRLPIAAGSDARGLHDAIALAGARLIVPVLADYAAARIRPQPQPAEGVTYAAKVEKAEGAIDWTCAAESVSRQVRALGPSPGVWCHAADPRDPAGAPVRIKVLKASPVERPAGGAPTVPGTVLDAGPAVACGSGALRLELLQRPGGAPQAAELFLRGFPLPVGSRLGNG